MSASRTIEAPTGRSWFADSRTALSTGMLLAAALTGCRAALPHATTRPTVPTETNAELIEYISDVPYVTAESAYRAVHILATGEVFQGGFGALTAKMETAGLVGRSWHYSADRFIDRATLGFLVARACQVRTGVNWRLTGLGRYAYRELIYHRIAHASGEYGLVSGGEFLGVLARAEEYLRKTGRATGETAELGGEPGQ